MKTSKKIVDINMKEDVLLASMYDVGTSAVKVNKLKVDPKQPAAANLMHGTACALASIAGNAENKSQRITLLVPDAIAVRCFEMLGHKAESADEISAVLYKDWMSRDSKAEAYAKAIGEMAAAFKSAIAAGVNVNFVNSRTIYRYELTGEPENLKALDEIDEITLTNSANADLGIAIRQGEFSFANGNFKVLRQTRRGPNGSSTHYYVSRNVPMIGEDGKRQYMPVGVAAQSNLIPANDAATVLVNVAKFRAAAAAYLPKKELVKSFTVQVAE